MCHFASARLRRKYFMLNKLADQLLCLPCYRVCPAATGCAGIQQQCELMDSFDFTMMESGGK